ncbi:MAG: hypothetical protein LKI53_01770 [Bacteroidales bacterium]|jgi:mannose-6-phosphate isomerase|nr:hypothetical protein [Bacteroidales bacterium]
MINTKKLYPFKFAEGMQILDENSIVNNGFLAENTLDEIIDTYLTEALGEKVFHRFKGIFPINVSIRDIRETTPLLTHPDDETSGARYNAYGNTKTWLILSADSDARLYLGFNRDMTAAEFYDRCMKGTIEETLNLYIPKAGEYVNIEPGCVYAASGIKIIEVSENSDATYKLCMLDGKNAADEDEKFVYSAGMSEAMDIIRYKQLDGNEFYFGPALSTKPLAEKKQYSVTQRFLLNPMNVSPSTLDSFIIYICLKGKAKIRTNDEITGSILKGNTYDIGENEIVLVPSIMEDFEISPENGKSVILEITVPEVTAEEEDKYIK